MLKKIQELRAKLNKWATAYYVFDNPLISDEQYDAALLELIDLEQKYPEYKSPTSPTERVGGEVLDVFKKKTHSKQMLSLANAFDEKDIDRFNNHIKKIIETDESIEYVIEPKIDGLSISLVYDEGKLIYGITRGNGIVGEDVTHNIKTIKSIPLEIDYKEKLEIRGEVFISKDVFARLNETQLEKGLPEFANPRNAAAGGLRQLDSKVASSREFDAYLYYLPFASSMGLETHYESIQFAKSLGFKVAKETKKVIGKHEIMDAIKWLTEIRNSLNYEIDGIVIKLNDLKYYEDVGYTAKAPKWAIAYKFPSELVQTELLKIFATVGRTGRINYNAQLSPVRLAGTTVSYATLHNAEYIEELDIRVGDTVWVKKAGDIIPKVLGPISKKRDGQQIMWRRHSVCPSCGVELSQLEDEVDQYCLNQFCDSRVIESLVYFCSRTGMDIVGMGPAVIKELYHKGLLKTFDDIYKLHNYKTEILSIERFGEKKIDNLMIAIEESKSKPLDRFLTAIGIRHIGSKIAKTLTKDFGNIEALSQAKYHDLENIDEIGERIANSIVEFFGDEKNCRLIKELQSLGVEMKSTATVVNTHSKWTDKKIVITGTLSKSRNYFKDWLESQGANVANTISKNTDFLLVGENAGSKKEKAIKLGVRIIKESDL